MVESFRQGLLDRSESLALAQHALLLRYPSLNSAPVEPDTLQHVRCAEDQGIDLWTTMNRVGGNLIRGGLSEPRHDRRGRVRSIRVLRGIDSKVAANTGMWGLAKRLVNGEGLGTPESGPVFN